MKMCLDKRSFTMLNYSVLSAKEDCIMVKLSILSRKIREHGFTQKEIANRINISEQNFSRKMQGKAHFFVDEVEALSNVLCLSREEMIEIFFTGGVASK